jgi:hypothetical protein
MNKILLLFILIVSYTYSCKQEDKKNCIVINKYPQKIIDLKLEKQYDKTKWLLYCIHCDEIYKFEKTKNIVDTISFGKISLKFDTVEQFNDTTEIYFDFFYRDTEKCDLSLIYNIEHDIGAAFFGKSDSIIYYVRRGTMNIHRATGKRSRHQFPLQPEVLQYIKFNKNNIDPWFKEEAILRGIIKDTL